MRWLRAMLIPAAMLLLVSCGSGDDDGGDATAAATSDGAAATATADGGGSGGSSGGSSSAASGDLDQLIDDLTPPNSNEVARFTAPDGTTVSFESTESVDDLKDFYEGKLADLGIQVVGTLSVEGGTSWIVGDDSGDGVGGTVSVAPDGDNSIVTIILGIGG